jgi:hypothetical protein
LPAVPQQALEPAVLEDEDEDPERRAERQRIHDQRFQRQDHRPRRQPEEDVGREADQRDRVREIRADRVLLVEERRARAADERAARLRAQRVDELQRAV